MKIGNHNIGLGHPVYIIAEMSANHGQNFDTACDIIRAIADSGADAVKLQTYTPDTLTLNSNLPDFQIGTGTIWAGKNLYQLYAEAFTPWEWQPKLFALAESLGLDCFSSPFDPTSVDFLEPLNPVAYKIASFELIDLPLIEYVAAQGRPIIMSTGMATLEEISAAVEIVKLAGVPLALLKCTSAYPAPASTMNLRTIPHLAETFGVPSGLSDHTLGIAVPVAAVALGASIIEKHFTLSRQSPGPDSQFSLEPDEFSALVAAVRTTEQALGQIRYEPTEQEHASRQFRRSLYVVSDLAAGEEFTKHNVRSIRPGFGLAPKHLPEILGKSAVQAIPAGTALRWDLIG